MKENKEEEQRVLNEKLKECERRIPLIKWRVGNNTDIQLLEKVSEYHRIQKRKGKPSIKDYMRKVDALLYFIKLNTDEQQTTVREIPRSEPVSTREEEQGCGDSDCPHDGFCGLGNGSDSGEGVF